MKRKRSLFTNVMITLEEKRAAILNKIKFHPVEADLKLCCYMAACSESALIPSPKDYVRKQPLKDALDEINENIPNLTLLKFYLEKPDVFEIPSDTLSVLYWLFARLHEPHLLIVKDPEDPILDFNYENSEHADNGERMRKPDYIMRFSYRPMSIVNVRWKAKVEKTKTRHGFTPVRIQDLHSVIHRGPKGLEDKGNLGFGLTLCSELGYAIKRAEASWVWGKSSLASQMYAVLVVEFVDTSSAVLRLARRYPVYYLISDTECARIRYLLLWISEPPPKLPTIERYCGTADISVQQRIIFSLLLIMTYLMLPKRPPAIFQRGFEKAVSIVKERFLQHSGRKDL